MPKSRSWLQASAPCRLEWRPSRWLAATVATLGLFAAAAALTSATPRVLSWPIAVAALVYGGWLAQRELDRPVRCLVIAPDVATSTVDGEPVTELGLQWRGPLAFLCWRDGAGRRQRLSGWPDVLDAASRRELRLAIAARTPAQPTRSMAP